MSVAVSAAQVTCRQADKQANRDRGIDRYRETQTETEEIERESDSAID
jgi:hypothetical protein